MDEVISVNISKISIDNVVHGLAEFFFDEDSKEYSVHVQNYDEYFRVRNKFGDSAYGFERALSKIYLNTEKKKGVFPGYCAVCEKKVYFNVDYFYCYEDVPAWREDLR